MVKVEAKFQGTRLRDARIVRKLTQTALAERTGLAPPQISQYENRGVTPSPANIAALASELRMPQRYFFVPAREEPQAPRFYRSLSAATKSDRLAAEVRLAWVKDLFDLVAERFELPVVDMPNLSLGPRPESEGPEAGEEVARRLRAAWKMGDGPIPNLTGLLEAKGAAVAVFSLGAHELSAFSQWTDARPYIISNSDEPAVVRQRFNRAHELGHLIMHRDVAEGHNQKPEVYKVIEQQAHRFAAAFLFPASAFCEEVYSLAMDALLPLKRRWGLSIAAITMRAQHLELISKTQAERAFKRISYLGFRRVEPLDEELRGEVPTVLSGALRMLVGENMLSREALRHALPFDTTDIVQLAGLQHGFLDDDWGGVVQLVPRTSPPKRSEGHGGDVVTFPGKGRLHDS